MGAMGEVEPSNVHPSPEKLLQHRHRIRRRSQSADNLSLRNAGIGGTLLQEPLNIYSRHF